MSATWSSEDRGCTWPFMMSLKALLLKVGEEASSGGIMLWGKTKENIMNGMSMLPSDKIVTNATDMLDLQDAKPINTPLDKMPPEQG